MRSAWILAVLLAGCTTPAPMPPACHYADGPAVGTTLSPLDFGDHFQSFFDEAAEMGTVNGWGGLVDAFAGPSSAPYVMAAQCRGLLFLQTAPMAQDQAGFAMPFGPLEQAASIRDLVAFVDAHPVAYLALGVEVNFWHEKASPDDWGTFVDWYAEARSAVKTASPQTLVFPTFQYERMIGEHGGLFGEDTAPGTQWELLDAFERDLTAFTTYPHLVRHDPGDVADDYWAPIREHVAGPLAFTETGWPARDVALGWESAPDEQAAFVDVLFDHAPAADLVLWPFLYDQAAPAGFDSMGLRADDGTPRPAWDRWLART